MLEFTISDPTKDSKASAPLRVTWYTDPHNVWCWGFEPMMRRLEVVYPDAVEVEIRMGGLFEDFTPVREQWARMSGGRWTESVRAFFDAVAAHHRMPMAADLMLAAADDFTSTWPACIAAKAAELQGPEKGRRYLRALREAWCLDGRGIHRTTVQTDVARETDLDVDAFANALEDGRAGGPFREGRQGGDACGGINGWLPWEVFEDVMRQVAPGLVAKTLSPTEASVVDLMRRYARCATREIAAILGVPDDDAEIFLEELEGTGQIERKVVGHGLVW